MARIPAQLVPKSQPIQLSGNVDQGVDRSGMIEAQNGSTLGNALSSLGNLAGNIYAQRRQEQNTADWENARRKFMEFDSERNEKLLNAQNSEEIRKIQEDYKKQAEGLLTGKDQKGVPYFRNEDARKDFDNKFLSGNLKKWHDGAVQSAWSMETKESQTRKNLAINDIINTAYDSPTAEADIREIMSTYPGYTDAQKKGMTQQYLHQLDEQRVQQHAAGFQVQVEKILSSEDFTATGKKKQVQEQVDHYSKHIDSLKTLSPAEKKAAKDRLGRSLAQVDAMVKDDKAFKAKQFKAYQEKNEADLITQIAQKGANLEGMPYREILDIINKNPDAFDQSFKEEILAGVFKANKKQAELAKKNTDDFVAGVMDAGKQMAIAQDKNRDLKLLNQAIDFNGSHDEWKNLYTQVLRITDTSFKSAASKWILENNPANKKPDEATSNKSLYTKQLDNILGFNLSSDQKDILAGVTSVPVSWGRDKRRYQTDDLGNELVDMLGENERLEIRHQLLKDYGRLFKEDPEKADEWIKGKMTDLEKEVDKRKFYEEVLDMRPEISKPGSQAPTATNPKTGEKVILKNGKWVPYGK